MDVLPQESSEQHGHRTLAPPSPHLRVHFLDASSSEVFSILGRTAVRGVELTASLAPHHLTLDSNMILPGKPIRSLHALRRALSLMCSSPSFQLMRLFAFQRA